MNTRILKVEEHFSPSTYGETVYSRIRLKGKWLLNAGFAPDNYVSVTVKNEEIIIRKENYVRRDSCDNR